MMEDRHIVQINPYSMCSYYAEVYYNDIKLSAATCFFTMRNNRLFLITNWHVVSGRDADTKEILSSTAAIPNKLRVFVPARSEEGALQYGENYTDIMLLDEEDNKLWYEMAVEDRMVDVAAIPLTGVDFYCEPIENGEEPFNENTTIEIASEIYVIGFPFGSTYGCIPIWKKASVASEPDINVEGLPYFFADTATRKGMSGSPVVVYENRPVSLVNEREGKVSRHFTKFVGIYSGRIGAYSDSRNDAQLGRIWKSSIIDRIIGENE